MKVWISKSVTTPSFRRLSVISAFLLTMIVSASCGAKFQTLSSDQEPHGHASGGSIAETAPNLNSGLEDQVAIRSESRKYPRSAMREWLFPILDGDYGSMWCVCRDIGTSPHIGVDLIDSAKLPNQVSIALSNGKVESVEYDGTCGWSVNFRDSSDSLWRYLHLNKPNVKAGQEVVRGTTFGINRDYPRSGCGNGAHLHLERRSAGQFGSKEEFRSCQYGRTSCYYNPVAPIEDSIKVPDEATRQRIVNQTLAKINSKDSSAIALTTMDTSLSAPEALRLAFAAPASPQKVSPVCNQVLKPSLMQSVSANAAGSTELDLRVDDLLAVSLSSSRLSLSFKLLTAANPMNVCNPKVTQSAPLDLDCLQSWKLLLKSKTGQTYIAFEATGTGHAPIEINPDQGICLEIPDGVSQSDVELVFEAKSSDGLIGKWRHQL